MKTLAKISGSGKALHVPAEVLTKLYCRATSIGLVLLGHPCVRERNPEALLDRGLGALGPPLEEIACLVEDPGLTEGSAGDHDAGAAGLAAHTHCVLRRLDVAVSEDGNAQRIDDGRDLVPARGAGVHLRARTWVEREDARARVLASPRDRDRVAHHVVPAAADLARHRQMCTLNDATNDLLDKRQITQAARAAVAPNDFLDRATEVDVDELGTEHVGDECGRLPHGGGIGAEDLNTDWTLVGAEAELVHRCRILAANSLGGEELRDDDVGAKAAAESPE